MTQEFHGEPTMLRIESQPNMNNSFPLPRKILKLSIFNWLIMIIFHPFMIIFVEDIFEVIFEDVQFYFRHSTIS